MAENQDYTIRVKRGTANEWAIYNPILGAGELGYDTTNRRLKVGDGLNVWSNIKFATGNSFDVARDAGFDGTLSEWIASLRGPVGKSGDTVSVGTITTASSPSVTITEGLNPEDKVLNFEFPVAGGLVEYPEGTASDLNTGTNTESKLWKPKDIADYVTNKIDDERITANVKDYGAVGDGAVDDTSAIQAAHNSGYKNIFYPEGTYYITKSIVVLANQKVFGTPSSIVRTDKNVMMFRAYAGRSNILFDTLTLQGSMPTNLVATDRGQYGISIEGVWDNKTNNVVIQNCTFNDIKDTAIRLQHTVGFQVMNNFFTHHGYLAVAGMSASKGTVYNNIITGTGVLPGYSVNSYGISFSQSEIIGLLGSEQAPRSSDVLITGNKVMNQAWTGIDSHCGVRITISNNHIIDCNGTAISVLYSNTGSDPVNALVGPKSIIIEGNTIEYTTLMNPPDGIGNGILLSGSVSDDLANKDYATGRITGNLIKRMGKQDSPSVGAISVRSCIGVVISENILEECRSNAFIIRDCKSTRIERNSIIDLWKTTGSVPIVNINITQEPSYTIYYLNNSVIRGRLVVGTDIPTGSVFPTTTLSGTNSANVTFVESGNDRGSATGYITQPVRYAINGNTKVLTVLAAPTTGTWARGDIAYNSSPAPSSAIGWVCTEAGTPGTWKSFGTVGT